MGKHRYIAIKARLAHYDLLFVKFFEVNFVNFEVDVLD